MVSGDKVPAIVKAVSLARVHFNMDPCPCTATHVLQFYKGTNLLDTVVFSGKMIVIDRQYFDESGVLEELDNQMTHRSDAAEWDKHCDGFLAGGYTAEARAWLQVSTNNVIKGDKNNVVHFVEDFYAAGARKVL